MSGVEAGEEWTTLLGGFLVAGAGVGLLNPVIADVAVSVVPKEQSGMAAGINDTFRQVGVAVGIAAWGAIFVGRGADKVAELTAGTPARDGDRPRQLIEAASSGNLDQALAAVPPGARRRGAERRRARDSSRAQRGPGARRAALLHRRGARPLARPRARDRARAGRARSLERDREPVAEAAPAGTALEPPR